MRDKDDRSEILFSYIRLDERIPADHPPRVIRQLVDAAPDEPADQQIIVEVLHQLQFRTHRVERLQQQRAQQPFRRRDRRSAIPGIELGECPRQLSKREHFSVDGTLIEAWASMKSFVPKDGSKPPPGKGAWTGRSDGFFQNREFALAGGLMSYGGSDIEANV